MRKLPITIAILIALNISQLITITPAFAQLPPASSNYKVLDYGFGSGGTASSSSNAYSIFGTLGQVDQGSPASSLYSIGAGLEYTVMATAPAAPTFVNSSNNYNKLHITINKGGTDPSDYQYAIQIASGSGSFQYVQNDHTVENQLDDDDWQSYASWGGSSGFDIIGLYPGTTYTARVAARQGQFFTQSIWGPTSIAITENPTLSFDLDVGATDIESSPPYIVDIGNLTPGSVTTATNKVWVDFATNATNGGFISINGTNNGLLSQAASYNITSSTSDLTAQPYGYGAKSSSVTQTSGGPMAPISPYNGSGENVGVLDTSKRYMFDSSQAPVTGGRVSFEIKAKASNTTPAASEYSDLLTVLATGSF